MASWSVTKPTWSLNQIINNLNRGGESWPKRSLTYRFTSGISRSQKSAITRALRSWSNVASFRFTNTTSSSADITFRHNSNVFARATWWISGSSIVKATVEFNAGHWENTQAERGGAFQGIMVHEIGHTLGFRHPGNYDGYAVESQREYQQDSLQYTVMSYFDHPAPAIGFSRPAEPLLHDIAAVQRIYGKNTTFRSGDTVYTWDNTGKAFQAAIWDTGGRDTIDGSNHSVRRRGVNIDLRAGKFSSIGGNGDGRFRNNVAIAFGVRIENAIGGRGNDVLTGNGASNVLRGGGGNDRLYGMGGNDRLYGGAGNDLLDGGPGNDRLVGGSGRDTYVFSGNWGRDTVVDNGGILRFDDRSLAQLTRTRSGSNLIIANGANTVTVLDYFPNRSQWEIRTTSSSRSAASAGGTGRVAVGGSVTGIIETSGEKDWFSVSLTKGRRYQIDLKGLTNSNVTLRLRDNAGKSLAFNDDISPSNRNSRIVFRADRSGLFFLEAGGQGKNTGSYRLSVTQLGSSATNAARSALQGATVKAAVLQQALVLNGAWGANGLSNSVTTPLSASFEKDWQRNVLAFSRG